MATESKVFERIYRDYLEQLAAVDLRAAAEMLGGRADGDAVVMPFFERPYRVSAAGISDPTGSRPTHSVSVLLSKYLLMCPKSTPFDASRLSYRQGLSRCGAFCRRLQKQCGSPSGAGVWKKSWFLLETPRWGAL